MVLNLTYCNITAEGTDVSETPLAGINITFHSLATIIAAVFGLIAVTLSLYLMFQHATHYIEPREQRYILRILFMVPVYAIANFTGIVFWRQYIYIEVLYTCYEAFAIASFFALMCHYIAPDLKSQEDYFRAVRPIGWIWPCSWYTRPKGSWKKWGVKEFARRPRSGLTYFNIIWFLVFQYCFIRVVMTMVAVGTQALGRYCLSSESPAFAHVWVTVIEGVSVTFAMFAILQFYFQTREDLAEYKPASKLLAIKLVIFLSFWQTILLSILTSESVNAINTGPRFSQVDASVGLPCLIVCIEMALFAVMHVFVYSWKPYDVSRTRTAAAGIGPTYQGGRFGIRAFIDAFNPLDILSATARAFSWVFVGRKHRTQDISYRQSQLESNNGAGVTGKKIGGKTGQYTSLANDGTQDTEAHDMPLYPKLTSNLGATPYRPSVDEEAPMPPHFTNDPRANANTAIYESYHPVGPQVGLSFPSTSEEQQVGGAGAGDYTSYSRPLTTTQQQQSHMHSNQPFTNPFEGQGTMLPPHAQHSSQRQQQQHPSQVVQPFQGRQPPPYSAGGAGAAFSDTSYHGGR